MKNLSELIQYAKKNIEFYKSNRQFANQLKEVKGINFHRRNIWNVGDLKCAPVEYLDSFREFKLEEIFKCKTRMKLQDKYVIVGGAACLETNTFQGK